MLTNIIKPEIGAPGASISAIAGSGTEEGPFGGTSGAAPMVTGSAALLKQAFPGRSLYELKAVLMNTAEINIMNIPAFFGGDLAAVSRIGGGEVRVDRALAAPAAAWDALALTGALSFGFHDVSKNNIVLHRNVVVKNYSASLIRYNITPTFRYANDVENGAVQVYAPPSLTIPPYATRQFKVTMEIKAAQLRPWTLNSGSAGANPPCSPCLSTMATST
jgi:subtilisin family serine protease